MKKRILCLLTCLAMVLCVLPVQQSALTAHATDKTVEEALAWVKSQVGQGINYDGVEGNQCVDLIKAYYSFLGVSAVSGDASDYTWNALPDGWARIEGAVPQTGDVLVYTGGIQNSEGKYLGHVAIYESERSHYHQNFNSHAYVEQVTYRYDGLDAIYWGVIRPNFATNAWHESLTPANLGDNFFANVETSLNSGSVLTVNAENNVVISGWTESNAQIWNFVRNADGSYRITTRLNGYDLNASGNLGTSGNNIQIWENVPQRWFLYEYGNGYFIRSEYGNTVVDVCDAATADGTNVWLYNKNDSAAQIFYVNTVAIPAAATLSVNAGFANEWVSFQWAETANTDTHILQVYNVATEETTSYEILPGATSCELSLDSGDYQCTLYSIRTPYRTASNIVSFTVKPLPGLNEDGWYYADSLPADVNAQDYEIQYKHTYQTQSTSSPGEEWTQGELASTQYENVGEPFYSAKVVETSDSCVMTGYYYYHYCGPSAGDVANYEYTDTFVHYDEYYDVSSVSVSQTGMDGEYPWFVLTKDGSTFFCQSGVTCDGSHGTHSTRSKAWYRMGVYQNRQLVNYYHYTKTGTWETEQDTEAVSVTYRYRAAAAATPGDVNLDGDVDVLDIIVLNKNLLGGATLEEQGKRNADVDGDGEATANDSLTIMKYIVKLIESL